jgi:hypothetical protein
VRDETGRAGFAGRATRWTSENSVLGALAFFRLVRQPSFDWDFDFELRDGAKARPLSAVDIYVDYKLYSTSCAALGAGGASKAIPLLVVIRVPFRLRRFLSL